jgi:CDP-diglyceride synthetase
MHPELILQTLLLLLAANGAPVLAQKAFGAWGAWPLDLGTRFLDGQPVLGRSKTFRGVIVGVLATGATAPWLGLPWQLGALAAGAAMAGDLLSSFVKRRLQLPPSSMAPGLDQVPESLFPFLACRFALGLSWADVLAGVALFCVGELALSRVLYALGIRDRPY